MLNLLWTVFESILESVALQPAIGTCKIDKSGNISTGHRNVQVKVKDGVTREGAGESERVRARESQGGREAGKQLRAHMLL